ncbi:Serine/threonine-protein kinase plk1, partial [Bonamia ostreae]
MSPNLIKHEYVDPKTKRSKIKKYERGEMLGRGGFAYCYAIESFDTQKKYACKIISKSKLKKKTTRLKLITEIKVHKLVSGHKNIVRFVKWFEDKERVYIVLELCKNKSLLDLVKTRGKLTESEVRYFMAQILSALRHIHSNNVIHRDLKLGNIFVCSNYMLKLGDFGLATKLEWRSQRKT